LIIFGNYSENELNIVKINFTSQMRQHENSLD